MDVMERIDDAVKNNPVLIFMKGDPKMPMCGFSSRTSQALMQIGEEFAYVNILMDPEIRVGLPQYSDWPTFPQVFVDGELIGGCDITMEMFENGELEKAIKAAVAKKADSSTSE